MIVAWSPVHENIFLFEIGQKMAEFSTKIVCPYMGASVKFGDFLPTTWANTDIFQY